MFYQKKNLVSKCCSELKALKHFLEEKKNIQETALGFWIILIFFPNLTQIHNRALPEWSLIFQLTNHLKKNDMKVGWIELSNYKYNITYLM